MRLRLFVLGLLWMSVIVVLASIPTPPDPSAGLLPKAVHAGLYAVLAILLAGFARSSRPRSPDVLRATLVGVTALLLGAAIEWYQMLLPHRTAESADMFFNGLGVAVGLLAASAGGAFFRHRAQIPPAAG